MQSSGIFKTPCPSCRGKVEHWCISDCMSEASGIYCQSCKRKFTVAQWEEIEPPPAAPKDQWLPFDGEVITEFEVEEGRIGILLSHSHDEMLVLIGHWEGDYRKTESGGVEVRVGGKAAFIKELPNEPGCVR